LLQVLYGAGIGISLALTGAGGSVIALPVLVYLLGIDPHAATGTSLVVVGLNAASAWAARAGLCASDRRLLSGGRSARSPSARTPVPPRPSRRLASHAGTVLSDVHTEAGGRICVPGTSKPPALDLGALGVPQAFRRGGGFWCSSLVSARMPDATGDWTSLFVIALNSLWGVAARLGGIGAIDLGPVPGLVLGGVMGAIAGARLAVRIDPKPLARGFAVFLVLVAIYVAVRTARGG
jgi:uncharacterized membrane protein YfcA